MTILSLNVITDVKIRFYAFDNEGPSSFRTQAVFPTCSTCCQDLNSNP